MLLEKRGYQQFSSLEMASDDEEGVYMVMGNTVFGVFLMLRNFDSAMHLVDRSEPSTSSIITLMLPVAEKLVSISDDRRVCDEIHRS